MGKNLQQDTSDSSISTTEVTLILNPGDPGLKEGLEVKSEDGLTNHLRKIAKKKQHNWTINKDGIFADKSETIFHQAKGHWNNFCKLVYTDHEQPPTEEQVLDYMKLKKEAGRSSSMVVEYKKGLGRVCALFCSVLFFGFLKDFFQCSLIRLH